MKPRNIASNKLVKRQQAIARAFAHRQNVRDLMERANAIEVNLSSPAEKEQAWKDYNGAFHRYEKDCCTVTVLNACLNEIEELREKVKALEDTSATAAHAQGREDGKKWAWKKMDCVNDSGGCTMYHPTIPCAYNTCPLMQEGVE
jgi:oligoribonuclease NrnB/cAMP/cGMP phosphodiesterase (DHH superfamily)